MGFDLVSVIGLILLLLYSIISVILLRLCFDPLSIISVIFRLCSADHNPINSVRLCTNVLTLISF